MSYESWALYPDSLFYDALMQEIASAEKRLRICTFIFKTSYAERTRAHNVRDALIAKVEDGVVVELMLNNARYAPQVAIENYLTGLYLAERGVQVRMGPRHRTLHAKIMEFDYSRIFVGSHNITRGGLTDNLEMTYYSEVAGLVERVSRYLDVVWRTCKPIGEIEPYAPWEATPLNVQLLGTGIEGAEITLPFNVVGYGEVDAFAGVCGSQLTLDDARMGLSVPPTARTASIIPYVPAGQKVYVAVRAYRLGQDIATSNTWEVQYQPTVTPPLEPPGETEGDEEQPATGPLPAPSLLSVTRASDTTVTLTWGFLGAVNFDRFEIEQLDLESNWRQIAVVRTPSTRTWTGTPVAMNPSLPFRVVVYGTGGEKVGSEERTLSQAGG